MNVFVPVHIIVADEYLVLIFGAAVVAPAEVIVTPEPAANVTCPEFVCWKITESPTENTEGGSVRVIALALSNVTSLFDASARTAV